jgi:hypothetical protein
MNKIETWLDSGHWTAETFKISVLMSAFLGGLIFIRHDLPKLIESWQESRAQAERIRERREQYRINKAKAQAAREILTNRRAEYCESLNGNKYQYLECLQKIER